MTYLPEVDAVWREFARVVRPGDLSSRRSARTFGTPASAKPWPTGYRKDGVWTPLEITGPARYLPKGYGGTPEVGCYYVTSLVS